MSLIEKEKKLLKDFDELGDDLLVFEFILNMTLDIDWMPEEERTSKNKVEGCQSGVWINLSTDNGKLNILASSDSLVVKGILALIIYLIRDESCKEISAYSFDILNNTFLKDYISEERTLGIKHIIDLIKEKTRTESEAISDS